MPTVLADERGPFGRNVAPARAHPRGGPRAPASTTPVVVAGGICDVRAGRGDPRVRRRATSSARRGSRSPIPTGSGRCGSAAAPRSARCGFTNYCEGLDQMHKQVTCKLWDREALDEPGIAMSVDGAAAASPRLPTDRLRIGSRVMTITHSSAAARRGSTSRS